MRPIRVMPPWLQNQIAAGEVVERPSAVVKELVENSIDAGATRVLVQYSDGGKSHVRIVDNGSGMDRENALLALERHATSKLATLDDLRNIRTFGFRGEALPSIASVSRFTLRTRVASEPAGTQILVDHDGQKNVSEAGMAPGTEIIVDELFHNVPARRKFLRADATEAQLIVEVVQRFALMHHDIQFTLESQGRTILSAPPESDPMARIHQVFGKKICDHLYECFLEGRVKVRGYISDPSLRKKGTGTLFLFVNSRFVRDKVVVQAVRSGYGTLLPHGDSPYAILNIEVPPSELDVNVHPTKAEVRFANSGEVFGSVVKAVKLTMAQNPHVAKAVQESLFTSDGQVQTGPVTSETGTDLEPPGGRPPLPREVPREQPRELPLGQAVSPYYMPTVGKPSGLTEEQRSRPVVLDERWMGYDPVETQDALPLRFGAAPSTQAPLQKQMEPAPVVRPAAGGMGLGAMRYLGQFANCFLLGQLGRRLVVVDQHAAHERVLFEQLRSDWSRRKVIAQGNLTPILLDVEPRLLAAALAKEELLGALGFRVEPFGNNKLALHSAPALFRSRSPIPTLLTLLGRASRADRLESDGPVSQATVDGGLSCCGPCR